jgi:hypothetical protein
MLRLAVIASIIMVATGATAPVTLLTYGAGTSATGLADRQLGQGHTDEASLALTNG